MTVVTNAPEIRLIASNLHRGGAVQVAASLIEEFASLPALATRRVMVELSSEVALNVKPGALRSLPHEVVDRRPWSLARYWTDLARPAADVTIVVFGPAWFPVRGRSRITGYADVTSVYPAVQAASPFATARTALRGWLSRRQLRRFDRVVVETDALANHLIARCSELETRVVVVPNSVSMQVLTGTAKVDVPPAAEGTLTLTYTTAAYPHKNLALLGPLAVYLAKAGVRVRYLLTLSDADWRSLDPQLKSFAHNVGPVRLEQLRALHSASDAIIFPSLLEASSATPLEALRLGTPLLASDRDFVRSVCGEAATYFDPLNAESASRVIGDALTQSERLIQMAMQGQRIASSLPTPMERAQALIRLAEELA